MYFCVLYFCIFVKACLPAIKGIAVWFLFTEITQYWNKSHKFQIKIKSNKFFDRNMVEVAQSQSQRFNRHISLNYLQWEKDGGKLRWQKCYFSKTLFHLTKIWWLSVFACVCHIYENTYCEKMRTNRVVIVDLSILKFPTKAKCFGSPPLAGLEWILNFSVLSLFPIQLKNTSFTFLSLSLYSFAN